MKQVGTQSLSFQPAGKTQQSSKAISSLPTCLWAWRRMSVTPASCGEPCRGDLNLSQELGLSNLYFPLSFPLYPFLCLFSLQAPPVAEPALTYPCFSLNHCCILRKQYYGNTELSMQHCGSLHRNMAQISHEAFLFGIIVYTHTLYIRQQMTEGGEFG